MVSGDPKPTITWKRYNTLVQDGTAKYSIDNSVDGQSTLTVKSVDKVWFPWFHYFKEINSCKTAVLHEL